MKRNIKAMVGTIIPYIIFIILTPISIIYILSYKLIAIIRRNVHK